MGVWAIVLAAGEGRRMGRVPKALLRFGDTTFLEAVAATAREAGVAGVLAVCGFHAEKVLPAAARVADRVALNPSPQLGMSSSVRHGAIETPDGSDVLLWPVDHPAVRVSTVRGVIEEARAAPGSIVVPRHPNLGGGHPTLFPARLLERLRSLGPSDRLDALVAAEVGRTRYLDTDDPAVALDVDEPADAPAS